MMTRLAFVLLLVFTTTVQSRDIEPVLYITAEDTDALLSDLSLEEVIHLSPLATIQLLGDEMSADSVLNIREIKNLPNTASGDSDIDDPPRPGIFAVRPLP